MLSEWFFFQVCNRMPPLIFTQVACNMRGYIFCKSRGGAWSWRGPLLDTRENLSISTYDVWVHQARLDHVWCMLSLPAKRYDLTWTWSKQGNFGHWFCSTSHSDSTIRGIIVPNFVYFHSFSLHPQNLLKYMLLA